MPELISLPRHLLSTCRHKYDSDFKNLDSCFRRNDGRFEFLCHSGMFYAGIQG